VSGSFLPTSTQPSIRAPIVRDQIEQRCVSIRDPLRGLKALISSTRKPHRCYGVILQHAQAAAETVLRGGVALASPPLTLSANALYVGQIVTWAAAKLPH
jgi:hypothetical protein